MFVEVVAVVSLRAVYGHEMAVLYCRVHKKDSFARRNVSTIHNSTASFKSTQ